MQVKNEFYFSEQELKEFYYLSLKGSNHGLFKGCRTLESKIARYKAYKMAEKVKVGKNTVIVIS